MTDLRKAAEMAAARLREAIGVYAESPEDIAALNALEAALDAQEQETVPLTEYKRLQRLVTSQGIRLMEYESEPEQTHPGYIIGSHWLETAYSRIAAGESEAEVLAEVLGDRGWLQRKAATAEEVMAAYAPSWSSLTTPALFFVGFRAAERFHGIKEDET